MRHTESTAQRRGRHESGNRDFNILKIPEIQHKSILSLRTGAPNASTIHRPIINTRRVHDFRPVRRTIMIPRLGRRPVRHARHHKKPRHREIPGFTIKNLAVTYFHMGKPHTIIGAEQFHFRVRDGIGWFPLAKAARQTGMEKGAGYIYLVT